MNVSGKNKFHRVIIEMVVAKQKSIAHILVSKQNCCLFC